VASVYVAKVGPSGQVLYAAAFGGSGSDTSQTINVDSSGNALLTGQVGSTDFPLTAGAAHRNYSQGFATEISSDGSRLLYSTFLGTQSPAFTALDASGGWLMAGAHMSNYANFPSSTDAMQPCLDPAAARNNSNYFLRVDLANALNYYATLFGAPISGAAASLSGLSPRAQVWTASASDSLTLYDAAARPSRNTVTCVSNAATYRSGAVAPGEIVSLFGPSIAPAVAVLQTVDGLVSSDLQGVRVLVDGYGAPLLYVSPNEINAVIPFEVAGEPTASIQVVSSGTNLPPVVVPVADAAPGIFTLDGSGAGYAAVINQDGTINSDGHPAARGSIVALFMTGAGMMQPVPVDGSVGSGKTSPALKASVTVAGQAAPVVPYVGDAPGEVQGLVQVNFQVPNVYESGYAPVAVRFGDGNLLVAAQALVWINVE
jgi:uncharacterized protein (TIGR03437 family)